MCFFPKFLLLSDDFIINMQEKFKLSCVGKQLYRLSTFADKNGGQKSAAHPT